MGGGAERLAFYEALTVRLRKAVSARCDLDRSGKDGETKRDRLMVTWHKTGTRPDQLNEPVIPKQGEHLWGWFWRLSHRRTCGYAAVDPLQPSEIQSFAALYRQPLSPWEVSALLAMDDAYLKATRSDEPQDLGDPQANAEQLKASLKALAERNQRKRLTDGR